MNDAFQILENSKLVFTFFQLVLSCLGLNGRLQLAQSLVQTFECCAMPADPMEALG